MSPTDVPPVSQPDTPGRTISVNPPVGVASMFVIGAITTSFAYLLWGRLLRDYSAAQVVPFALLVPFVGAGASAVVFGETFGPLRLGGMLTVVFGIAIMVLAGRSRSLPKVV